MDELDGGPILPEPMARPLDESQAYVACGVLRSHGIAAFVWHPFAGGLPHCSLGTPQYCLAVEAGARAEVAAVLNAPVPDEPPEEWTADPAAEIDPRRIGTPDAATLVLTFIGMVGVTFVLMILSAPMDRYDPLPTEPLPPEAVIACFGAAAGTGVLTWLCLLTVGAAMRGHAGAQLCLRVILGVYLAVDWLGVPLLVVCLFGDST